MVVILLLWITIKISLSARRRKMTQQKIELGPLFPESTLGGNNYAWIRWFSFVRREAKNNRLAESKDKKFFLSSLFNKFMDSRKSPSERRHTYAGCREFRRYILSVCYGYLQQLLLRTSLYVDTYGCRERWFGRSETHRFDRAKGGYRCLIPQIPNSILRPALLFLFLRLFQIIFSGMKSPMRSLTC